MDFNYVFFSGHFTCGCTLYKKMRHFCDIGLHPLLDYNDLTPLSTYFTLNLQLKPSVYYFWLCLETRFKTYLFGFAPISSNSRTQSTWPHMQLTNNGVWPLVLHESTLSDLSAQQQEYFTHKIYLAMPKAVFQYALYNGF